MLIILRISPHGGHFKSVVSAPGKVLIAGGYLILDPDQIGLVLALSARIHVEVLEDSGSADEGIITVVSPQFLNAEWKYKCTIDEEQTLHVEDLTPKSSNDYVRITVSYVLAYIVSQECYRNAKVTIYADNDYYSQSSSPTYDHLRSLPRFNNLNLPISKTSKTGLGSSAALIAALTAALLAFYANVNVSSDEGRRIVHNLAQAAHCAAQGKVGSGFDIAAAVYGSCVYRRFVPEILQEVLLDSKEYKYSFRCNLQALVGREWEMQVKPFEFPPGLRIVMGDVAAGSATPSMVRSVLKWKANGAVALKVWDALGVSNKRLIEQFDNLRQFSKEEIIAELRQGMHTDRSTSNPRVYQALNKISEEFEEIRSHLRRMGSESSVPIEPETQTSLLDASLQVNGVLIAGVPGAGGYDAIFCVIADDGDNVGSTFHQLLEVWKRREVPVCPLLTREANTGMRLEE